MPAPRGNKNAQITDPDGPLHVTLSGVLSLYVRELAAKEGVPASVLVRDLVAKSMYAERRRQSREYQKMMKLRREIHGS